MEIFDLAANEPIKKQKYKLFSVQKRRKDLDGTAACTWKPEQIRKACAQNFN